MRKVWQWLHGFRGHLEVAEDTRYDWRYEIRYTCTVCGHTRTWGGPVM